MRPRSVVGVEMGRHQGPEAQPSDLLRSFKSPALGQLHVDLIEDSSAPALLGGRLSLQLVEFIPLELILKIEVALPAESPAGMGVGVVEVPHVHPQRFDLYVGSLLVW